MMIDPHGPVPPDTFAALADRAAICELPKIYALGIDLRDEVMVRSVFTRDAPMRGMLGEQPAHEYLPRLVTAAARYDATMHNITNQYATLDGDQGTVWSYAVALHFASPDGDLTDLAMGVQYRDRCTRIDRGWLVTARETIKLWSRDARVR